MVMADDAKQAIQTFLVPELDAIKAQIAEVRGVQNQMSERLGEQAAQILAQRHEAAEASARMEARLDGRMNRIEDQIDKMRSGLEAQVKQLESAFGVKMEHLESTLGTRMEHAESAATARMDRFEDKLERQTDKLDQLILLLSPQNRATG